ncbi:MAG: bifunctional UDP-N-acetylmuramoyl-tripeptide:D-alanyl-D-alanine ligase/alanine racemase [Porphyromonadaceae bacterium]|nr:bifunctional UDP-N-acetylmuramoyl-tripeptide:D-alanyl-D-alanine ligase/alanine racemase [Porphyromonadaceae bacterium]
MSDALASLLSARQARLLQSEELHIWLTDSRSLSRADGTAFIAIRTASGDGHRYIRELYARGVRTFIVEDDFSPYLSDCPEANFVWVDHSIRALQRLAAYHRRHFCLPIIGITGSNGKTIVKEFLYTLLRPYYKYICRSPRSYNSQIGVALSLLQLEASDELALIEAGISYPGEMQALADMIVPSVGILTSLGSAHAEHFASADALLDEKLRLFSSVQWLIAPLDYPLIRQGLERAGLMARVRGWSRTDRSASLWLEDAGKRGGETLLHIHHSGQVYEALLPMSDEASIENAMTALSAIATLCPDHLPTAIGLLHRLRPVEMRLEVKESYRGNTIINDSYSNDLDALRMALDFQRRRVQSSNAKAVVVLSDIEQSPLPAVELYAQVAELLEAYQVAEVFAVGPTIRRLMGQHYSFACMHFDTTESLLASSALYDLHRACILLKGARFFGFERIYRDLSRLEHQTTLEVNLSAVRHNLAYYRSLLPRHGRIICMIKADGYGIGALELARTLQESRVDYLAVAVADEGKALRLEGIRSPIIVMNPELSSSETLFQYNLEPEVYSLSLLRGLIEEAEARGLEGRPIHIKVDSGMHRLGFTREQLPELIELLGRTQSLHVASVFSHLASADEEKWDDFSQAQAEYLMQSHQILERGLGYRPLLHLLNTAGMERFATRYAFDMARLGIGLYGMSPINQPNLKSVVRLSTTILQVKDIAVGQTVGYGCRGLATRPTRIAVIPIGYADGFRRMLSNGAWSVAVRGRLCPTIGNICMDACMIDITDVPEAREGDRVLIFGDEALSIEQMAEACGTISYEILTTLSHRIQRLYYQE